MIFREYVMDDLDRLLEIYNECFSCDYNNCLNDSSGKIFVLDINKTIVGMATLDVIVDTFRSIKYGYVNNVCVIKEYRGLGYGRYIMLEIDKFAKNNGLSYIILSSNNKRKVAQNLYRNIGYKEVDTCFFKKDI